MSPPLTAPDRLRRLHRAVRRRVLARRRLLAALSAGVAVAAGLHTVAGPPPPTVVVTTAARDLPAGTVLAEADLGSVRLDPDAVPRGATGDPAGRVLAAPLREGEPVTDVRLVGNALAEAHPGLTAMPVRIPDRALVELLAPGDRIDLIATDSRGGGTRVVAPDALVLATPAGPEDAAATTPGAVVVLGVPSSSTTTVAEAGATSFLGFAFAH